MDDREPFSPIEPADSLRYETPLRGHERPSLVGLSVMLLVGTIVTMVGLSFTVFSVRVLLEALRGDENSPAFVSFACGPIGLLFLIGGGYVMWRTIGMLRRR